MLTEEINSFSTTGTHFCPSCHLKRIVEFGEWLCKIEMLVDAVRDRVQYFGESCQTVVSANCLCMLTLKTLKLKIRNDNHNRRRINNDPNIGRKLLF